MHRKLQIGTEEQIRKYHLTVSQQVLCQENLDSPSMIGPLHHLFGSFTPLNKHSVENLQAMLHRILVTCHPSRSEILAGMGIKMDQIPAPGNRGFQQLQSTDYNANICLFFTHKIPLITDFCCRSVRLSSQSQ